MHAASSRRENASLKNVTHGRPRFRPVREQTNSTSSCVWSRWPSSNGRSPWRGGGQAQLPVKGRRLDAGPRSLALGNLLLVRTAVGGLCERLVTWRHDSTLPTRPHQRRVDGELSLL